MWLLDHHGITWPFPKTSESCVCPRLLIGLLAIFLFLAGFYKLYGRHSILWVNKQTKKLKTYILKIRASIEANGFIMSDSGFQTSLVSVEFGLPDEPRLKLLSQMRANAFALAPPWHHISCTFLLLNKLRQKEVHKSLPAISQEEKIASERKTERDNKDEPEREAGREGGRAGGRDTGVSLQQLLKERPALFVIITSLIRGAE